MENDVFLQHAVFAKRGFSGIEDVEAAQFQLAEEVLAEGTEVGAIAEAPRRDSDELPAGKEQTLNQRDEAGVEVARFNADGTQGPTLGGVGADFSIRRIYDSGIEGWRKRAE